MIHQTLQQLLTIFSASTLIYLGFSALELAVGRYKLRGISLNDWIVDIGCYAIGRYAVPPLTVLLGALLTVKLMPQYANALAGTPVWAQFLAFVVFEDMAQYWWHRACHTFPKLWPLHLAHHGAPYMGVRMASRNSFLYQLLFPNHFTAAIMVYLGFGEVYVSYRVLKNFVTTAAHSTVPWDYPLYRFKVLSPLAWVLERVFSTPATHYAHHALHEGDGIGHYSGNFGNLSFLWDVMFGTALFSRKYPEKFGLPVDPRVPGGQEPWYVQFFYPLFKPRTVVGGALPHEEPQLVPALAVESAPELQVEGTFGRQTPELTSVV